MGIFDSLFGKGAKSARQKSEQATHRSVDELNAYRDILMPQVSAGNDAMSLLRRYLGLDGVGSQARAYDSFQTDPGFQSTVDFGIDNIMTRGHALGLGKSGGAVDDVGSFAGRMMQGAYNDRLGALYNILGSGQNAAGQYGNATNTLVNTLMRGAETQGNADIQKHNARNQVFNTGLGLAAFGAGGGFGGGSLFGGPGAYGGGYGSMASALPIGGSSSYGQPDFRRVY